MSKCPVCICKCQNREEVADCTHPGRKGRERWRDLQVPESMVHSYRPEGGGWSQLHHRAGKLLSAGRGSSGWCRGHSNIATGRGQLHIHMVTYSNTYTQNISRLITQIRGDGINTQNPHAKANSDIWHMEEHILSDLNYRTTDQNTNIKIITKETIILTY